MDTATLPISEHSGYLQVAERHLYVTTYTPSLRSDKPALIMFEPFGEEKKCALRLLVRLARACAAQGFPVLRADLSGTGDSSAEHGQMNWDTWLADGRALVAHACATFDNGWLALGTRLGALLATQLAAGSPPAAGLLLIEPILDGNDALRDLERRQAIKDMMGGGGQTAPAGERWAQGLAVDFGGFEVSAAMARDIAAIALPPLLSELPPQCRVQAIRVSGSQKLPPAWEPLTQKAAATPGGAVVVVRDKPFWGQLEYYESDQLIDQVLAFISGEADPTATPNEVTA